MSYFFITPFFPNKNSHVGSYLLDQAKEINKQIKSRVFVIVVEDFFNKSIDYKIEGIQCYTFKKLDFPSFFLPGFFQKINNRRFSKFLKEKQLIINDSSVVHGHINYPSLPFLSFLKKKFKCKTILQHHGLDVLQFETGRLNIFKKFRNNLIKNKFIKELKFIDLHLGVSQLVLKKLYDIDKSIETNSYTLYNGVDTKKFYPIKKTHGIFKIGCIANFWKLKDQITLIKSLHQLHKQNINDWCCEFVGNGPTIQFCIDYVNKNNIPNIKFTDKISHKDLNIFYNNLSLFVLPSYYEALGCVYLESWATNTPFIAIKEQGIEEILNDNLKQKFLIEKGDYLSLAKNINNLKNNYESITFDSKYDIENTISNFLYFIKNK